MTDPRHKRTQEEMDAIPTVEQKYALILSDTIRNVFVKDNIEQEVKHVVDLEEFADTVNFNKFFCGGLLALYDLYKDLIQLENFTVLDFLYILLQLAVNMNIDLAKKEAIEQYIKDLQKQKEEPNNGGK